MRADSDAESHRSRRSVEKFTAHAMTKTAIKTETNVWFSVSMEIFTGRFSRENGAPLPYWVNRLGYRPSENDFEYVRFASPSAFNVGVTNEAEMFHLG